MHSRLPTSPETKEQNPPWLLLAFLFLSRVLIALLIWKVSGPSAFFNPDTDHYVLSADSLRHGSFSVNGAPETFRTPGYPLLLVPALAYDHFVLVALLENFVLATLTAWLVWRVATHLLPGTRAGWWAVILYFLEPIGLLYSQQFASETAFTTLLLLFLWLFLRFLDSPTYSRLSLAALVLGGATYVRPVSLYLPFILSTVLLFFPRGLPPRARLARALGFSLAMLLLLAPWVARNMRVADYSGFSSSGDWNLYFYSAAAIQAKLESRDFFETQIAMGANNNGLYFQLHPERRAWPPGRLARAQGREARQIIAAHWPTYVLIHLKGCVVVLFAPGATEILRIIGLYPQGGGLMNRLQNEGFVAAVIWLVRTNPLTAFLLPLLALQLAVYYMLALFGLRRLNLSVRITWLALGAYFVMICGMPGAVARYRGPLMPMVCICAGAAIAHYRENRSKTRAAGVEMAEQLST